MPTMPIPIFGDSYKNSDPIELSENTVVIYDGWRDSLGGVHRRPGRSLLCTLGTNSPVDGLWWWEDKQIILAVSAGRLFKIFTTSGLYQELTGATVSSGVKPTFTTDGTYAFVAAGKKIIYTDGVATCAAIADADAPTSVTHVAFIDTYILGNSVGTRKFFWSDPGTSLVWSALNFASAEKSPDLITAAIIKNGEIFLFGSDSVEIWESDGSTPFSPIPGGSLTVGCQAPESIVETDNEIYWITPQSHFVRFAGRNIERVSTPYDKEIEDFSFISDCIGYRMDIVGRTFLVFTFPTANRTIVYNVNENNWTEWGNWIPALNAYDRWLNKSYAHSPKWRTHLVGDREVTGKVFLLGEEYLNDGDDPIRLAVLSGHIDHGSLVRKRCNRFRVRAKRGASTQVTGASQIMYRVKDNNKNWSIERSLSLGEAGQRSLTLKAEPKGIYRTRQWEISSTDLYSDIILVAAEEDVDLLRN